MGNSSWFRPSSANLPAHGHPSRCRLRRTDRVVGRGPERRHSPFGSGGVTQRSRCRRCKRIAEREVRIHSPPAERCYGAGGEDGNFVAYINRWSAAMPQPNDLSRSLVALDQDSTIIVVVEMSQSSWLVGGVLPGIERHPRKKLEPNPERLLALLHRWRDESVRAGRTITRIAVAFEAGRDGFWLARWLEARGVEPHVIHPSSVAVSREHRRAKTDRLDTELLKRGFLGWLRGERGHCSMARVPTIAEEDAKRPNRERECLVKERTRLVNRMKGTLARLGIRNFRPT